MLGTYYTRVMRISNTCYARIINAPCAYRTHAAHVFNARHARIERTYHYICNVRIERMLRPNHIRAKRVSNTCYARITHVPCAYRTHDTHVLHTRHARIENTQRTYHTRAMRVSNTCYARITLAPCAYRTHAAHVSRTCHARIEHMLRINHSRAIRVLHI